MITDKEIEFHYKAHLKAQAEIWEGLKQELYLKYLSEGYYTWWAEIKAEKEVLRLRSIPDNPTTTRIPEEFTRQGDLD